MTDGTTTRDDLLDLHGEMTRHALNIMKAKNHDYAGEGGDDALANFRACEQLDVCPMTTGILIRMVDKYKRIVTFEKCGRLSVENESAEDALLDIINYSVILAAAIRERDTE